MKLKTSGNPFYDRLSLITYLLALLIKALKALEVPIIYLTNGSPLSICFFNALFIIFKVLTIKRIFG
jgi:hypothetical protein